jgi:bifunctional N-acetylglucosamine-1-phosphate-uridyltransferase/glucosamine-1-phosphate-acetyltransferase GlmU-like protein
LIIEKIGEIKNDNAQKEYYLTDLISMAPQVDLFYLSKDKTFEVMGVNNIEELGRIQCLN